jgi:hypothetical protein
MSDSLTLSLSTRQSSTSKEFIDEVLSLYQSKPTEKSYSHRAENAVFHDPVSRDIDTKPPSSNQSSTSLQLQMNTATGLIELYEEWDHMPDKDGYDKQLTRMSE